MADALRPRLPLQVILHDLCEEAQWKLSALLPSAEPDRFRTLVVVGKGCEEIVRVARDRDIDLIMLGGRRRTSLTSFLRRNLTEQVTRRTAIPVITVWHSGHVIADASSVSDSLLCEWPSQLHTAQQPRGRKSKAQPMRSSSPSNAPRYP
jgi:hypothetical protein